MKKKGFTLVELLAVIVILAVIALISTPIILNVIEESKKGAAEQSALGYIDALEKQIVINSMDEDTSNNIGNGTFDIKALEVNIKGTKPTSGSVTITKGKVETAILIIGEYSVTVGVNGTVTSKKRTAEETVYKCKRATTLHTEECTQTDSENYCSGAGYTTSGSKGTSTITYGNLGTKGKLTSGDAFDCDVNGDGKYDAETERFYYVSDLDSNSDYAVLIYYNNTKAGVADNTSSSLIAYDSSGENWHGPRTAITNLPTVTQWSNVSLASTTRAITTETGTTSTKGGTLPTSFSYEGYASRLITAQEINSACGITIGSYTRGELDKCNYLMENTTYSNSVFETWGYWLENPLVVGSYGVWSVRGVYRRVYYANAIDASNHGVRPTIEILKSKISY